MNHSILLTFLHFMFFFIHVRPQNTTESNTDSSITPIHPSLSLVIGILASAFSLTFLLIAYARFCQTNPSNLLNHNQDIQGLTRSRSQLSGINRTLIDSIPFFRFSSLKGSKQGLECAVCISRFEDSDVLRLLPKCRHAFHMNCIDKWLANHSSCPLCRYKFDPKDLRSLTYSNSLRYLNNNPSNLAEDPCIELFVQREEERQGFSFSSRFNFKSFQSTGEKDGLLVRGSNEIDIDKFKHKIIISDVVSKNRWSDVNSSDLILLNSEMLSEVSNNRFPPLSIDGNMDKIKEDIERKRLYESKLSKFDTSDTVSASSSKMTDPVGKRSMSEITKYSRFKEMSVKNSITFTGSSSPQQKNGKEERLRRLWLPIVRRTVQWFAGREQNLHESDYVRQHSNV